MPTILPTKSIYYDNVNLIAQPQYTISSRSEIPEEKFRICVSPMAAIVGKEFAVEAYKLGLTVFLHRFKGTDDQIDILKTINPSYGHQKLFCSVGLNEEKEVKKLIKNGAKNILIDIANGYLDDLVKFTAKLLKEYPYPEFRFCVGNVHSADGESPRKPALRAGLDFSAAGCYLAIDAELTQCGESASCVVPSGDNRGTAIRVELFSKRFQPGLNRGKNEGNQDYQALSEP
jgi:hypothetical protein